jgi:hypothetical protein
MHCINNNTTNARTTPTHLCECCDESRQERQEISALARRVVDELNQTLPCTLGGGEVGVRYMACTPITSCTHLCINVAKVNSDRVDDGAVGTRAQAC